jgi:uncharacterized membrane protein
VSRRKKKRVIIRRPPATGTIVTQQSATLSTSHSGPLPTPRDLADYAQSGANFPDRIMSMAEREQIQRHAMESEVVAIERHHVEQTHRHATVGQRMALAVALAGMGVSVYMAHLGHPREAVVFGGADLAALVSVFFYTRKHGKDEVVETDKKSK